MTTRNSIPIRSDPRFVKEIEDMKTERIMKGKDRPLHPIKTSRITLAMTRHGLFKKMKQDIIDADLV